MSVGAFRCGIVVTIAFDYAKPLCFPFHVLTLICVYYTTLGVPELAAKLGRIELTGELADPRTKVSVLSNAAWTIFQPDRQTVRL